MVYAGLINKTITAKLNSLGKKSAGVSGVDGVMLDEEYVTMGLTHMDSGAFTDQYPLTIPEGFVFVMGDNRNVSKDSRSSEVGLIPLRNITGKAVLRIYPFSSFGAVE